MEYDYLVVGAGLFGSVFARQMSDAGCKALIVDQRKHIGGNTHTRPEGQTNIHVYGPHLFHTNSEKVWNYVNRFAEFNHYRHRVKANYEGRVYSLPFNMMTFYQFWGCTTPEDAKERLKKERTAIESPKNMEEQALALVGPEIYHTLIYGYTKKQWHRCPRELPAFIIQRLPIRFTYDDHYFNDRYQGVPKDGYTSMVENMIDGIDLKLETDFFEDIQDWRKIAKKLVYSGSIDQLFSYKYGDLEYLTLEFNTVNYNTENFQGIGQMNHTSEKVPHTRVIEHKHFYFDSTSQGTSVTFEYPVPWERGKTPYYPVNTKENCQRYQLYFKEAKTLEDTIIGGRLGCYRYMDMHQVVGQAMSMSEKELKQL